MGNRQISQYAFSDRIEINDLSCENTYHYNTLNLKTLESIRSDIVASNHHLLNVLIEHIITAVAYLLRTDNSQVEHIRTVYFYSQNTLIFKLVNDGALLPVVQKQCNLDILFRPSK